MTEYQSDKPVGKKASNVIGEVLTVAEAALTDDQFKAFRKAAFNALRSTCPKDSRANLNLLRDRLKILARATFTSETQLSGVVEIVNNAIDDKLKQMAEEGA